MQAMVLKMTGAFRVKVVACEVCCKTCMSSMVSYPTRW
jgi:hypothetical protein